LSEKNTDIISFKWMEAHRSDVMNKTTKVGMSLKFKQIQSDVKKRKWSCTCTRFSTRQIEESWRQSTVGWFLQIAVKSLSVLANRSHIANRSQISSRWSFFVLFWELGDTCSSNVIKDQYLCC
jgi:hypothetical protein